MANGTMSLDDTSFDSVFAEAWPAGQWRDVHVQLAVSGGADSVALLRLAHTLKQRVGGAGRLWVAHFNHGIRPSEAAEDAAWLSDLCRELQLPCEVGSAAPDLLGDRHPDGLEAAAREARYTFLLQTAERLGARFVAVAHTADDQVETVLHRLLRGTGLAGLAGMPRARPLSPAVLLVRPLLDVRRQDVERYLAAIGQEFRSDATNRDRQFTRNRLRHELLPQLRAEFNSDVDSALLRLAQQAEEAQRLVARQAAELVERAISVATDQLCIGVAPLAAEPPLLIREACKLAWTAAGWPLQEMGFEDWHCFVELVRAGDSATKAGQRDFPGGFHAERRHGSIKVTKLP
jgi:tRNA(Ile)-lysidine synthase